MLHAAEDVGAPAWYKDAIFYELHVRSFFDGNGDGIGDFAGLTKKLEYLQELGVTALWLMPFYPSPLRDDGYDVADYVGVHPSYGTLRDMREFVREAHRRGMKVITELVCNHTSDQHPWFQRARRGAPGSSARNFYVWSDTPDRYPEVRVIFKDYEASNWTWDPVARAYYWHRFYSHQPDLNFDHPPVRRAILKVAEFWLSLGVDGFRLDAIPYLFERDGTNGESLPETHAFVRELRRAIDAKYRDRVLIAEANQWPEDAAAYYGAGDECHMCFHFPLMPRLFLGLRMEDRFPIVDILAQTPAVPDGGQWGLFLRNHDELTLEMVTDEERDLMHRTYTHDPEALLNLGIRRRLAPLLGNNRRRIELIHALLFSLPGTPFLYYGDEIGMGDDIRLGDRDAVRTPMQWTAEPNGGFSEAGRRKLFLPMVSDPRYHYRTLNVAAQLADPQSLLLWMRQVIALRRQHPAFGRGAFELVRIENRKVLAFVRSTAEESILVVANLSRYVQSASLDLSAYRGYTPVELFGKVPLPTIGAAPYVLTLAPQAFYWLSLTAPERVEVQATASTTRPSIDVGRAWRGSLDGSLRPTLQRVLPSFIAGRPWSDPRDRTLRRADIREVIALPGKSTARNHLALVELTYPEGEAETHLMAIGFASGADAAVISEASPDAIIANLIGPRVPTIVYDASVDPNIGELLLSAIARKRRYRGVRGVLVADQSRAFATVVGHETTGDGRALSRVEQRSNTVIFGERVVLKLFRRLERGTNPELDLGYALTDAAHFPNVPQTAGSIAYVPDQGEAFALALLRAYSPSEGTFEAITSASLRALHEEVAGTLPSHGRTAAAMPLVFDAERATLLGQRMAELHLALAAVDDPAFQPEPFTRLTQRSLYQSLRVMTARTLRHLGGNLGEMTKEEAADARFLLRSDHELERRMQVLLTGVIPSVRIRIHGDLHLGQILMASGDVTFIDFEGESWRTIGARRRRRSPLRDVATALFSYDRIADLAAREAVAAGLKATEITAWTRAWRSATREALLSAYLAVVTNTVDLVPADPTTRDQLLDLLTVERALGEIEFGLRRNNGTTGSALRRLVALIRTR